MGGLWYFYAASSALARYRSASNIDHPFKHVFHLTYLGSSNRKATPHLQAAAAGQGTVQLLKQRRSCLMVQQNPSEPTAPCPPPKNDTPWTGGHGKVMQAREAISSYLRI